MDKKLIINFLWDMILIMVFTIPHSALLSSKGHLFAKKFMPSNMFGTFYSIVSSLTLLLMFFLWRPVPIVIYQLHGVWSFIFLTFYIGSWAFMVWAQISTGALHHIGVLQWYDTIHGQITAKQLPKKGAYQICRHPIFLAFFGMIWLSPTMTWGHLLLSVTWSGYLIYGTIRKENTLMKNKAYRQYASQVPSYPILPKDKFCDIIKMQRKNRHG